MDERYTRLFSIAEQEPATESTIPAKIMAGALLLDNQQQKVIAQIKFKNISQKSIKSMLVDIYAYDKNGVKVKTVKDYTYANLIAGPDDCFGDKTPISMEDNNTHSFDVHITNVQFSDGTSWSQSGETAIKVAKQTVDFTATVTRKTFPFVVNTIVFVILLLSTLGLMISEKENAYDVILIIGFALMTIISFPAFGTLLAGKQNGNQLRITRWIVVAAILILLLVCGRTIA